MKKIFYLGYYDTPENKEENRNIVLAATNKMTYIISAIERAGYNVEIVSASQTRNSKKYDKKSIAIGKKSRLVLLRTIPWGNKIRRICSVFYSKYQLIRYVLKNINENDSLVVYHSVAYADIIRLLKKIKKFKLYLEVEEIYSDVNNSKKDRKKELKLFNVADAYVFSTELLNEKVNKDNKPSTVIYGTYQIEKDYNCKLNDNKIHIVYAGTFDPRKGGVQASLSAVPYLDEKYHMHILGFGNAKETQQVKEDIKNLSAACQCKVTYDGLLSGEEYIRFLQSCHIGMSTQNPAGGFNDTSFPSKILSYMANGLSVVTIKIKVLEESAINSKMCYYNENNGEAIAEAIRDVDVSNDNRKILTQLDGAFVKAIGDMLGD